MNTWWVHSDVGHLQLNLVSVLEIHSDSRWAEARQAISAAELRRAEGIRLESAKKRYLATRAFVRATLSSFVHPEWVVSPREWEFQTGPHGRPEVGFPVVGSLSFNISHTEDHILCGISTDGTVGVDIETWTARINIEHLVRKVFASAEQTQLCAKDSPEQKKELFFVFWTLKEAYLKGLGTGILLPLQSIDFGDTEFSRRGASIRLRLQPNIPDDPSRWRFSLHQPVPGYQIGTALAVPKLNSTNL
ncbi:MAG: 4'-phosphopantetheinyl transferase superfamily protein [Myxococcales bacterium]|nr:4'-phosphopantetheinyl transferase superfamily protein [Myxococcales bacterium]